MDCKIGSLENSLCQGLTIYTKYVPVEFTSSLLPLTYFSLVIWVHWEHTFFSIHLKRVQLAHSETMPRYEPKYDKWGLQGYSYGCYPKHNTLMWTQPVWPLLFSDGLLSYNIYIILSFYLKYWNCCCARTLPINVVLIHGIQSLKDQTIIWIIFFNTCKKEQKWRASSCAIFVGFFLYHYICCFMQ